MIKDITVQARPRDKVGKSSARRLRAQGLIPASVYGPGRPAVAVELSAKEIANILRSDTGHNTIFKLALPGAEATNVIIKDWQICPVKGRLLHVDLMALSMTSLTRVSVPIEVVGEPVGVRSEGGIFEMEMREVEVECLPGDIPDHIRVDVSNLHIGQHVTVSDLIYDRAKVKLLVAPDHPVAGVLAPRLAEEAAPAPEAAPTEPEVIKKGKAEEEKGE
jgi:large subunit ribosomal protein L25